MLASPFSRTLLARTAPSSSHGTAAQHFRLWMQHGVEALARFISKIARFLPHIHAFLSAWHCHVSLWTLAVVLSLIVDTVSYATYLWVQIAFIYINAARFSIVQDEAFVAGAHEATESIGTVSVLTDVLMLLTLVDVFQDDGNPIRSVTRSARTQFLELLRSNLRTLLAIITPCVANTAAASSLGHCRGHVEDTLRLSSAMFEASETERFPPINASVPSLHQIVVRRTLAHVLALSVYASTILAGLRILALVNVRAITTRAIQFIPLVALATEHAEDILAAPKHAQIAEHLALVYVHARLLVILIGVHEAHLTLAAERAGVVEAVAVLAEGVVVCALVYVLASVTIAPEAGVADALERSFSVDALGIRVAAPVVGQALVDIPALDPITYEALVASALV